MIKNFSLLFLFALALMVALRLWLSWRQIAHVRAHRESIPQQFAGRIELSAHHKAADYSVARTRFGVLTLIVEVAVLLAFTFGGGLQALDAFWSVRLSGLVYGVAMVFSVVVISGIIDLPFLLYMQFVIEERFGFNRMTVKLFFTDLFKQALLGAVIGAPVLLAVLSLMGRMGELWWLYVWSFWVGFNLLIMFIYPTWIAPLFNKFSLLDDTALKSRIEALLARCGFATSGLFVMDGSKRSNHGNAYFTGFGKTKRIVFFDTLLGRLQPAEVEAVLAHELGHFKHRHVIKRLLLLFGVSLAFLAGLGQLIDSAWFFNGLGVRSQNTTLALLLFFMVVPVFTFLTTPLMSVLSRRHEFEADRYACAHASGDKLVEALVKLYEDNATTLTPDPVHSLFFDSHPPAALRIERIARAVSAAHAH